MTDAKSVFEKFSLTGRTALVTGASSGLGRHFGHVLAAAGARVVLAARRTDRLNDLADQIVRDGGEAMAVAIDVTDLQSVAVGLDAAVSRFGALDVVVNNAGVPSSGFAVDVSDDHWREVMDVNLDGVFRIARESANRMRETGGGCIVNIASILGLGVTKGLAPYATSKAAVVQMTKAMALELARERIRVNALAPGYFVTELNADFLESEAGQRMMQRVPMLRFGQLADLDGPLLLLCSDAGAFMTGSVVIVDGGHAMTLA